MRNFMDEIAKPILPGDEHLDYVPTQAVAEYLAHHHNFDLNGINRRIDAIIFRSAQTGRGKNIALIGPAALVEIPNDGSDWSNERFSDFDPWDFDWDEQPEFSPRIRLVPNTVKDRRISRALIRAAPHRDHYPPAKEKKVDLAKDI